MENTPAETNSRSILFVAIAKGLIKGFSVLYFLLLPILYSEGVIDAIQLGYIGTILIVGVIFSALLLSLNPHKSSKGTLLRIGLLLIFISTILLLLSRDLFTLIVAYSLIGIASGLGMIIIEEFAAQLTTKGKRFGVYANLAMFQDIIRISYPLAVGAIYIAFKFTGIILFALILVIVSSVIINLFLIKYKAPVQISNLAKERLNPVRFLRKHKSFAFVVLMELLDSFSSSQLFVFLPTLLVFKNFSIEFALGLQSIVFVGYLFGRWFVSFLAKKFSGFKAVAIAEAGMVVTIVLILVLPTSIILYFLCFLLGIFTRGTSAVIKALAFDQLEHEDARQGAALHVIGGDSGGAIGQFVFGLSLAWFGVAAPFIGSAIVAGSVAIATYFYKEKKVG